MSYNDKTKQYVYEYKAKNIKRVPLDMPITEYDQLKQAAVAAGMTVNGFIKQAIRAAISVADGVQASPAAVTPPVGESGGVLPGGVTPSCTLKKKSDLLG